MRRVLTALTALSLIGWGGVAAQGLEQALEGVTNGKTAFRYPIREGVEVCEHGIRIEGSWRSSRGRHALLDIARDDSRHRGVCERAMFWIGQEVAEIAARGVIDDGSTAEADEVKEAAVFALSQRAPEESIPVLMELAQVSAHPEVRRSAVFWLSQSGEGRVLEFFERVLEGA